MQIMKKKKNSDCYSDPHPALRGGGGGRLPAAAAAAAEACGALYKK